MTDKRLGFVDFSRWLRTGRWVPAQLANPRLEVKFNPYHDPANGEFTFAPGGGEGNATDTPRSRPPAAGQGQASKDPKHPRNFSVYTVQSGDTLEHIAATRVGVTPADLKWLNDLPSDRIRIGQRLRLPNQAFLDEGKRAFDTYVALRSYMDQHGGRLPPNVAHPPSLDEQSFGPGTHIEQRNGYGFTLDGANRPRKVAGTITLAPKQRRSTTIQLAAGGADRLPGDHGGHFIARRFNGPPEDFNHFAQDGNFNQSGYAKLENEGARATRRGEKVHVTIAPEYPGDSRRPNTLIVTYSIGGRRVRKLFPNSRSTKDGR